MADPTFVYGVTFESDDEYYHSWRTCYINPHVARNAIEGDFAGWADEGEVLSWINDDTVAICGDAVYRIYRMEVLGR